MPSHRPSPKKDWRGPQQVTPARPPASRKGLPWLTRRDRRHEGEILRRRAKLAAYLVALATMLVVFVLIIIFWPVPTPMLVVRATDYPAPVPPNSWTAEDAGRLLGLQDCPRILTCAEVVWDSPEQGLRLLQENLDALKPGGPRRYYVGPRRDLVILYLSIHGVVDSEGRACLLLPGASPREDNRWLPVTELLERLFKDNRRGRIDVGGCGGRLKWRRARPLAEVNKLLVLDCPKVQSCWPLGVLQNGFTNRLADAVEQANVPNLWVLAAAGGGQRAWSAPELGGSVFGVFFQRGIEGAADRARTGNRDRIVSLKELEAYLKTSVDHWVREHRSATQTPIVLGPERDILLTYSRRVPSTPEVAPAGTPADPRWTEIADRWKLHGELAEQSPWTWAPLRWARLEHTLLRLEKLASAGRAYHEQYEQARGVADTLISRLRDGVEDRDVPAHSLALQRAWYGQPQAGTVATIPAPWRAPAGSRPSPAPPGAAGAGRAAAPADNSASAVRDTEDAAKSASPGNTSDEPEDTAPASPERPATTSEAAPGENVLRGEPGNVSATDAPYPYLPAAAAVWNRCRDMPDFETIDESLAFLNGAAEPPDVEPAEIHLLRMLHAHLDEPIWDPQKRGLVHSALRARELAEQASAPRDVRAAYWTRRWIDEADRRRREAEDRLLIGNSGFFSESANSWETLIGPEGGYQRSTALSRHVEVAFALRDRAFARLPHLAKWALEARLTEAEEKELLGSLKAAVDDVHQLAADLDLRLKEALWPEEQVELAERLQNRLMRLEKAYADHCDRLLKAGEDMETLARIEIALRQPLVSGSRRNRLREKYHGIAGRIPVPEADYTPDSIRELDVQAADSSGTVRRRLELFGARHPALGLIGRESLDKGPPKEPLETLDQQGGLIRRLLHGSRRLQAGELPEVFVQAEQWGRESAEALRREPDARQAPQLQYAAIREPCSKADRLVRAAAALLSPRRWESREPSPAENLRRFDTHHMLTWHAARTVEDFWGPRPGATSPYFELASQAYLDAVRRLFPESSLLQVADRRRAMRTEAAQKGLQPEKPEHTYYDEDNETVEHRVSVAWPDGMAPGEAAFYMQPSEGTAASAVPRIVGADQLQQRRSAIALSGEGGRLTIGPYRIRSDQLRYTTHLDAVALYRGHLHRVRCEFLPLVGWDVVPAFQAYQNPRITVRGEKHTQVCVLFVLDCSWSMNDIVPGESKQNRLQVASGALRDTLRVLGDVRGSPYYVGLSLYGHRTQWRGRHAAHDEFDTFPAHLKTQGLNPANDVELVVPMDHLPNVRGPIDDQLAKARPRGETPLHLSIIDAMEDLQSSHPQAEARRRHIVVITDGKNEQSPGFGPMKGCRRHKHVRYTQKEIREALARPAYSDIQLDIVGFHLAAHEQKELEGLGEAARRTGGDFHLARHVDSLIASLEGSLKASLNRFTVNRISRQEKAATREEQVAQHGLKETVVLEQPQRQSPQVYRVRVPDPENPVETDMELWGGEDIVLELHEKPDRLVYAPFDSPWGRRDHVEVRLAGERFDIVAHQPEVQGDDVRFYVSVENKNAERFSPRPAEVWAEIHPVGNALPKSAPTYVFFDPTYMNNKPVPVLQFVALDWRNQTGGASEAEIQLWVKMQPTTADQVRSFDDLMRSSIQLGEVTFSAAAEMHKDTLRPKDSSRLIVLEKHESPDAPAWVKVELVQGPNASLRRYSPQAGLCRHVFASDGAGRGFSAPYTVRLTKRESMIADAIALPRTLKVHVVHR